ncbi:MAG: glycosyltransferase family 2 protein [Candidatus Xenobium sp.]|nr:NTP transferase domain-containing protein [Burkholderiales bacterium]
MIRIVIPMAGRGSRFEAAGYERPKPLIEIHGVPMIDIVVRNLSLQVPHRFIFLPLRQHLDDYDLLEHLQAIAPGCEVVPVEEITQGAACTILLARHLIEDDGPLILANSDQYLDIDMDGFVADMERRNLSGLIMTFPARHPKWSYARVDPAGLVREVIEKQPISRHATTGVYLFRRGRDFVRAAQRMIDRDFRVHGEFYTAPVYNYLIAEGARVGIYEIAPEGEGMFGMGTPEDLEAFLDSPASLVAAGRKPA